MNIDKPLPAEPSSSAQATEKIAAVGRRVKSEVKSALSSNKNEPSVRIIRDSKGNKQRVPTEKRGSAQPPTPSRYADDHTIPSGDNEGKKGKNSWFRGPFGKKSESHADNQQDQYERNDCYDRETVDLLDVVDPEVSTLSTLTNVQNSLFVPSMGKIVNRRATYKLQDNENEARTIDKIRKMLKKIPGASEEEEEAGRTTRLDNPLPNAQYAILPDGEYIEDFSDKDKAEIDDAVRHQLHSKRAKFKRAMQGFKQYVRRPLGLFITVYATLITLFGAAWVLFLIGWISLGSKEDYVVNIVDNVLVALFAIIGDGLAPFRAVDTYHMIYIAHYHRKTWKRRDKLGLPELMDHNDLPDQRKEQVRPTKEMDIESLVAKRFSPNMARRIAPRIPKRWADRMIAKSKVPDQAYEYSVLTTAEQERLDHHERKFSKSHTFYKPHETETHFAFPLKLLVAVVVLLDCHSLLQISLGACTWGINYHHRPFALTTVILCCSITCNITGGILISIGDKRTRKHEVIERIYKQELTSEAIETIREKRLKELEERGELDPEYRKRVREEKEAEENEEIKRSWKSVPSLPKKLLGKGEDHRQPSLPQEERRRSSADVARSGSTSGLQSPTSPSSSKHGSHARLPPLSEDGKPVQQKPIVRKEVPPKQSTGQKVMGFVRKADLDRS